VVKSAFCFAHGSTGYGGIVVMRLDLNAGDRGFESRFGLYFFFVLLIKINSMFSLNSDGLSIVKVSRMGQLFLDGCGSYM
jgi:hypothetical protein